MNNPYEAPKSRVSTAEPMPGALKIALALIALLTLMQCFFQFTRHGAVLNGEISGVRWIAGWIWAVIIAGTGVLIAYGTRWARWLLAALAVFDIYLLWDALRIVSMLNDGSDSYFIPTQQLAFLWLGPLLTVAATILVFGPGRRWSRRD